MKLLKLKIYINKYENAFNNSLYMEKTPPNRFLNFHNSYYYHRNNHEFLQKRFISLMTRIPTTDNCILVFRYNINCTYKSKSSCELMSNQIRIKHTGKYYQKQHMSIIYKWVFLFPKSFSCYRWIKELQTMLVSPTNNFSTEKSFKVIKFYKERTKLTGNTNSALITNCQFCSSLRCTR